MPYKRLSDSQFRSEHRRRITSPQWRQEFRPAALAHFGHRCAECGSNYRRKYGPWQLEVDHKYYWKDGKLVFGRETFADVRTVCPDHHRKGTRTDETVATHRASYLAVKAVWWLTKLPLGLLWAMTKRLAKMIRKTCSRNSPPLGER